MSGISWFDTIRVPYFLVDVQGRMSIPQLMTYLIYVSGQQTESLPGKSAEDYGFSWIIIQYELEVKRLPMIGETIETETVAHEYNRIASYRDFYVRDQSGDLLLSVTASFALMNEDRKLARIPKELAEAYGSTYTRKLRRTPKPTVDADQGFDATHEYRVRYFDIDENGHVNNAHYFSWMLDTLPHDFLKTHTVQSGNILFEKEVRADEIVQSAVQLEQKEGQNISRHLISCKGEERAIAEFVWEKA